MTRILIFIAFLCVQLLVLSTEVDAFGGFGKGSDDENEDQIAVSEANTRETQQEDSIDFSDPELLEAIQTLAHLSPEEMMETIDELKEIFRDDPDTLREIEDIMLEITKLDASEIDKSLKDLAEEEMVAYAMGETLELLKAADENDWQNILDNKDTILETVIASNVMSQEEIEHFVNDPSAWENELQAIWKELKMQAAASGATDVF